MSALRTLLGWLLALGATALLLTVAARLATTTRWEEAAPPPSGQADIAALRARARELVAQLAPGCAGGSPSGACILPPGQEPGAVGDRLAGLFADALPGARAYLSVEGLDAVVRVYAPGGAVLHLRLLPTLDEPSPPPGADPPLLTLLVRAVGPGTAALLARPEPFAVSVPPFDPFALRLARDALRSGKEVVLDWPVALPPGISPRDALLAVPGATAVVLPERPAGLPLDLLARRGLPLLDPTARASGPPVRAALARGLQPVRGVVPLGRAADPQPLRRWGHLANRLGAAIALVEADGEAVAAALRWLRAAEARGYRPAYVAEAVRRLNAGDRAAPRRGRRGPPG